MIIGMEDQQQQSQELTITSSTPSMVAATSNQDHPNKQIHNNEDDQDDDENLDAAHHASKRKTTNDNDDDKNPSSSKQPKYHSASHKKAKKHPNPRKQRRKQPEPGEDNDVDDDVAVTVNKGSLANPEMQLPQFGYYGAPGEETMPHDGTNVVESSSSRNTVKRRVALILGFVGSRYHGFQMQPQRPTLQAMIEYALYRAKFISSSNFGVPFKYGWSHSARTDRGVHAAAHVCSCKLEVPATMTMMPLLSSSTTTTNDDELKTDKELNNLPDTNDGPPDEATFLQQQQQQVVVDEDVWYDTVIRNHINSFLPDDIRIFKVIRTTRNFCAKNARDQVRYQYWFPSFVLMPKFDEFWQAHFPESVMVSSGRNRTTTTNTNEKDHHGATTTTTTVPPYDPVTLEQWHKCRSLLQDYRISDEQMQILNQTMKAYQGTHSFHYFTKGMESGKAQALRYIIDCSVQKRYMAVPSINDMMTEDDNNGPSSTAATAAATEPVMMEWISADIVGQSFLLNQIRKMMSMAMDVTRGKAPLSTLTRMLERQRGPAASSAFRVAVAPAQGLFLDLSYYHSYNRKCKSLKLQPLLEEWAERERQDVPNATTDTTKRRDEGEDGYQRWQSFKNNVILPHMVKEEWEQGNFLKYLVQQEYFFDHVNYYQLETNGADALLHVSQSSDTAASS
jgi:tRNA pseudouridine(38-40) synthase